jgi:hypothetical protein
LQGVTWFEIPCKLTHSSIFSFSKPFVATLSGAWFCYSLLAGIVGTNPAEGLVVCPFECCVLSGTGVCDGLITRPQEFYRVVFVWVW